MKPHNFIFHLVQLAIKSILLIGMVLCGVSPLSAQQGNNWYFGDSAGINFNSGAPVALTNGAIETHEGCAAISDLNGDLLFYTDGTTVWNKIHDVMDDGTGLNGHSNSTQSAIIVPRPGVPNRYYIFTVFHTITISGQGPPVLDPGTFNYSEVDMTASGGLGAVIDSSKNTLMQDSTLEKLTAIRHGNGSDVWVVVTRWDTIDSLHLYNAYQVSSSGVDLTPVSSPAPVEGIHHQGCMKGSHGGSLLATGNSLGTMPPVYLSDFNDLTGQVSNHRALFLSVIDTMNGAYGIEFSPNDQFLYASRNFHLTQYDVSSGDEAVINNSLAVVDSSKALWGMQLGPDQKVYIVQFGDSLLASIQSPNLPFPACNFQVNSVSLNGRTSNAGLPAFFPQLLFSRVIIASNVCLGDSMHFSVDTAGIDSLLWHFGDSLALGSDSVSSEFFPAHLYSDTGIYTVSLTSWTGGIPSTDLIQVTFIKGPVAGSISDTVICQGDSIGLDAFQLGMEYLWQGGSNDSAFIVKDSGAYSVAIYNSCDTIHDTAYVGFSPSLSFDLGSDLLLCDTSVHVLDPGLGNQVSYLWSDASADSMLVVNQTGQYWLEARGLCDTLSDSITVTFRTINALGLPKDTAFCVGDSLVLYTPGQPEVAYEWSNGSLEDSIFVSEVGSIWLEALLDSACGTVSDTTEVSMNPLPRIELGEDQVICSGASVSLDASHPNAGASYVWNTGDAAPILVATEDLSYVVTVTLAGCTFSDTVRLLPDPACELDDCWIQGSNVYTPNGDGLNDRFGTQSNCAAELFTLRIFNRWGTLVFTSSVPAIGWDGYVQGTRAAEGVYYWITEYRFEGAQSDETQSQRGTVQLFW